MLPWSSHRAESFREQFIKNKVEGWVKELQLQSNYAQDDPQAAYSAFTKGLCSRWILFQRTVPDTSDMFEPLENAEISYFIGRW